MDVIDDVIFALINPLSIYIEHFCMSGIVSTIGIMAFHINHLFFYSNLTLEDWIHHLVSSILLPISALFYHIVTFYPYLILQCVEYLEELIIFYYFLLNKIK